MNKPTYRNIDGELLTYKQTAERCNIGVGSVMKLAEESGTVVKIDRISRVIYKEFLDYIIENYRVKKEND